MGAFALQSGRLSLALGAGLAGCGFPPPVAAPAPAVQVGKSRPAPRPPTATAEITSDCGIPRLRDTVLQQVNAARAAARSCGPRKMQAVPALAWNRSLAEAAELHSVDMVVRDYFDHVSPDGKRVGQRVTAQGYKWKAVGENLAGGDGTVSRVLAGWLKSPEHCQNMMNPVYAEIGVACVRQAGSKWETYWTMVLATGAESVNRRPRATATGPVRAPAPAASGAARAAAPP